MELLQSPEDRGYPTEYLVSRIRGRRAYFLGDWDSLLFHSPFEYLLKTHYRELITQHSVEGVWKRLLKERRWVYLQMNKHLRDIFRAFFQYAEIKALIVCFRLKLKKGTTTGLQDVLSLSILSEEIKELMEVEADLPLIFERLENELFFTSDIPGALKESFLEGGLRSVEKRLTDAFLERIIRLGLHPVIKNFFTFTIDSKNIIALYKHLRWGIKVPPPFIRGGSISETHLTMVIHTNAISEVPKLIYRLTGLEIEEPTVSNLEKTLLKGLTNKIKVMSRRSADIGLILDYLWRCSIEAQNLSIILYGGEIDRDVLKQELVV
jgi:vacuolar-type H+-ATPase subunit C/Vma6